MYMHMNRYTHWSDSIPLHEGQRAVLEVVWEQGQNAASSIQHRSGFTTSPVAWHPTGIAVASRRPLAHTWVCRTANLAAGLEPVARNITLICLLPFLSFNASLSSSDTHTILTALVHFLYPRHSSLSLTLTHYTLSAALAEMPDTVRVQKPLSTKTQQLFSLARCPVVPTWGPR